MPDDLQPPARKPRQNGITKRQPPAKPDAATDDFDEVTYLRAFPDVLDAVERGDLGSGREHYLLSGQSEGRLEKPEYRHLLLVGDHGAQARAIHNAAFPNPSVNVDALLLSRTGAILLIGWADDGGDPLTSVTVLAGGRPYSVWTKFPRLCRPDVGRAINGDPTYPYGFWGFAAPNQRRLIEIGAAADECLIELHFTSGAVAEIQRRPKVLSDRDLRDTAMGTLAGMTQPENRSLDSRNGLDGRIGAALVEFNRMVSHASQSAGVTEHFGRRRSRCRGSIIVSLHDTHEHLFLQSCAFAQGRGIDDYEFIYIVTQPDLMQPALHEARIAEKAYGLPQTLLLLPAETSLGSGLNLAAQLARSDRLLFIRPDVFPCEADWAAQHSTIVSQLPESWTRLFGATVYYDNGSIRHAGLYFERRMVIDSAVGAVVRHPELRVETYGNGAPAWAEQFTHSRPVPAVSGAFLSIDRSWFEQLGGYSECYQSGQHEDVDLCLRSLKEGSPAWVHPIPVWQLDLNASAIPPVSDAGSILNRWFFNQRWNSFVVPDLIGKAPRHPLLSDIRDSATPPDMVYSVGVPGA